MPANESRANTAEHARAPLVQMKGAPERILKVVPPLHERRPSHTAGRGNARADYRWRHVFARRAELVRKFDDAVDAEPAKESVVVVILILR